MLNVKQYYVKCYAKLLLNLSVENLNTSLDLTTAFPVSYSSQGGLYISYLSWQYIYGIGRPSTDFLTHRGLWGKRAKMFDKATWPVCGAKPHSSCTNVCLQISNGEMNNAISVTNFWKQHSHWTEAA